MSARRNYFRVTGDHAKKLEVVLKEQSHGLLDLFGKAGTVTLRMGALTAVKASDDLFIHGQSLKSTHSDLKPISEYQFRRAMKKALEGDAK